MFAECNSFRKKLVVVALAGILRSKALQELVIRGVSWYYKYTGAIAGLHHYFPLLPLPTPTLNPAPLECVLDRVPGECGPLDE